MFEPGYENVRTVRGEPDTGSLLPSQGENPKVRGTPGVGYRTVRSKSDVGRLLPGLGEGLNISFISEPDYGNVRVLRGTKKVGSLLPSLGEGLNVSGDPMRGYSSLRGVELERDSLLMENYVPELTRGYDPMAVDGSSIIKKPRGFVGGDSAGPTPATSTVARPMVRPGERSRGNVPDIQDGKAQSQYPTPLLERQNSISGREAFERVFGDAMKRPVINPDRYEGKVPWREYRTHFESCKVANGWTDEKASTFLAACLKGPALGVLGNFEHKKYTYAELVESLERRFGTAQQAENYLMQLRLRRQKEGESIQQLGQVVRELAMRAYPAMLMDQRERLAKGHFMEAVMDPDVREGIFRACPNTLDAAIAAALNTEGFQQLEKQRAPLQSPKHVRTTRGEESSTERLNNLERAMNQLAEMTASTDRRESDRTRRDRTTEGCYRCGVPGHFARECRTRRPSGNAGQPTPGAGGRL